MRPERLHPHTRTALLRGDHRDPRVIRLAERLVRSPQWTKLGVVLLDGVPTGNENEAGRALCALSRAMGPILPQDSAGVLVREVRYRGLSTGEGTTGRYSDSRDGGQLHTDGPHRPDPPPEIFTLLCVRQSQVGGALILVAADDVVRALDAGTVDVLRQEFCFDRREAGTVPVRRRVLRRAPDGHWRFAYLRSYIERGHEHPDAPALTGARRRALDQLDAVLDEFADDPGRRLKMRPGQLVIVDNRRLLHGRTPFEEGPAQAGRLLLRTWIRTPDRDRRPSSERGTHVGPV